MFLNLRYLWRSGVQFRAEDAHLPIFIGSYSHFICILVLVNPDSVSVLVSVHFIPKCHQVVVNIMSVSGNVQFLQPSDSSTSVKWPSVYDVNRVDDTGVLW